ncbi:unnamed protein product, partial [Brenthis ino]
MNYTRTERKEESPHSRLFVVCNKQLREDDLLSRFECFGTIEDLYMPKDRNSGESKGVAYIKYNKTSSAAAAIKELHLKVTGNDNKPMKVMVAVGKNESTQNENEDRYKRLFIKVHKDATESEIRQHFINFGHVESVHLQRDKVTDVCKGFAYVQYKTFYDAAKAYEECDKKYRAVFATPRDVLKRSRNSSDTDNMIVPKNTYNNFNDRYNPPEFAFNRNESFNAHASGHSEDFNSIIVKCTPQVPQKCIEQLFNIIPGLVQFQYSLDTYSGISKALITYKEKRYAEYAIVKLNNFEFPSGEIISVRPDKNPLSMAATHLSSIANNFKIAVDSGTPDLKQLADAIAKASSLIKAASNQVDIEEPQDFKYCSVSLPSPKPMVDINSRVAQRLFIICKPHPPPITTLQDVFCRFGDLINVSTIPNKTFGFVKYASSSSAQEAMKHLNGATVTGIKLKVLEADERPLKSENDQNENTDYDKDSKRMRLTDKD